MSAPRLLIVDDEPDLRKVMQRGLELAGCRVDSMEDPKSALAAFKPGLYELVILDIGLPEMDGFELYEELLRLDSTIKVCFLTAFDMEYFGEFRRRFPNVPGRCFVKKPVALRDLITLVQSQL
ncbi:MAG TPA: response regulator [Nitrososphaera sp.]|nr:response regulator [Nitrososphaera sp.]